MWRKMIYFRSLTIFHRLKFLYRNNTNGTSTVSFVRFDKYGCQFRFFQIPFVKNRLLRKYYLQLLTLKYRPKYP